MTKKKSSNKRKTPKGRSNNIIKSTPVSINLKNDATISKKKVDNDEIEDKCDRRSIRLSTIVAIVVILGSISLFLFKLANAAINQWPEKVNAYSVYFMILFIAPLSVALIVLFDIIVYILVDLKRYDVLQTVYKSFDIESDKKYSKMIRDFKIGIWINLFVLSGIFPVSFIYDEQREVLNVVIGIVFFSILVLALIVIAIARLVGYVKTKDKYMRKEKRNLIFYNLGTIGKTVLLGVFIFTVALALTQRSTARMDASFTNRGLMTLENESDEEQGTLFFKVYDNDHNILLEKTVDQSAFLFAKESKMVKNEIREGLIVKATSLDSERLYWKYIFDLKDLRLREGTYCVSIKYEQKNREIEINNMFSIGKFNKFEFANDRMEKEY